MLVNPYEAPRTSESPRRTEQELFVEEEVRRVLGPEATVRAAGYVMEKPVYSMRWAATIGLVLLMAVAPMLTLLLGPIALIILAVIDSSRQRDIFVAVNETSLVLITVPWPGLPDRLKAEQVQVVSWADLMQFEVTTLASDLRMQIRNGPERRFSIPAKPYFPNSRKFVASAKFYISQATAFPGKT